MSLPGGLHFCRDGLWPLRLAPFPPIRNIPHLTTARATSQGPLLPPPPAIMLGWGQNFVSRPFPSSSLCSKFHANLAYTRFTSPHHVLHPSFLSWLTHGRESSIVWGRRHPYAHREHDPIPLPFLVRGEGGPLISPTHHVRLPSHCRRLPPLHNPLAAICAHQSLALLGAIPIPFTWIAGRGHLRMQLLPAPHSLGGKDGMPVARVCTAFSIRPLTIAAGQIPEFMRTVSPSSTPRRPPLPTVWPPRPHPPAGHRRQCLTRTP